jgi:hypothetical protein
MRPAALLAALALTASSAWALSDARVQERLQRAGAQSELDVIAQSTDLSELASSNGTTWACDLLSEVQLAPGAVWQRLNCSSKDIPFWGPMGPLVVNVVAADLSNPSLSLVPVAAQPVNDRSTCRAFPSRLTKRPPREDTQTHTHLWTRTTDILEGMPPVTSTCVYLLLLLLILFAATCSRWTSSPSRTVGTFSRASTVGTFGVQTCLRSSTPCACSRTGPLLSRSRCTLCSPSASLRSR